MAVGKTGNFLCWLLLAVMFCDAASCGCGGGFSGNVSSNDVQVPDNSNTNNQNAPDNTNNTPDTPFTPGVPNVPMVRQDNGENFSPIQNEGVAGFYASMMVTYTNHNLIENDTLNRIREENTTIFTHTYKMLDSSTISYVT